MPKFSFETPNQRQMYIDMISNVEVTPLPPEYDCEVWEDPNNKSVDEFTDEEIEEVLSDLDESLGQDDSSNLTEEDIPYTYDPTTSSIAYTKDSYDVRGLFNADYENLYYNIDILKDGEKAYTNDYSKEFHNQALISDEKIDELCDLLITYAMESDSRLHENFSFEEAEFITEDKYTYMVHSTWKSGSNAGKSTKVKGRTNYTSEAEAIEHGKKYNPVGHVFRASNGHTHVVTHHTAVKIKESLHEDFTNINILKNIKGKGTLKLKNGDTIDVSGDEARVILKHYDSLKGDIKNKFASLLDKSQSAFLLAYKDAYQ